MALASLCAIIARTHAIQLMLQVGMTARVRIPLSTTCHQYHPCVLATLALRHNVLPAFATHLASARVLALTCITQFGRQHNTTHHATFLIDSLTIVHGLPADNVLHLLASLG